MAIHRLNHAVLFVRDLDRSVSFYRDVLGFKPIESMAALSGAAFLRAPGSTNDHDLGLFQLGPAAGPSRRRQDRQSACTTWPGRSTHCATSATSRPNSRLRTHLSARPTTAPPSRCTDMIRTASSSNWPGSSLPINSTRPRSVHARASSRSTCRRKSSDMAPTRPAASGSAGWHPRRAEHGASSTLGDKSARVPHR